MSEGQIAKSDVSKVKVGDVFSRFSTGTVVDVKHSCVIVKNTQGRTWEVSKEIIEDEFAFAGHGHQETEKMCRTDLIAVIENNPRTAMSITFEKKVETKEVAHLLADGQGRLSQREWSSRVSKALKGETRTLQGVHQGSFDPHGRLFFSNLGEARQSGIRLVDLRTVKRVTVNNKEFLLK